MNKKNILILPSGTGIGLEIINALKFEKNIQLFGASSEADHSKYICRNIEYLPDIFNCNFILELNKLIAKNKIDLIYPALDDVCLFLSKNEEFINAKIIGSSYKTNKICRSKLKTYKFFKNLIKTPDVYSEFSFPKFPVFLKPDCGSGSKGVFVANTIDELKFYKQKDSTIIAMEYLPGEEYTIDCFTDKNGALRVSYARKRERIKDGISVNSIQVNDNEFIKMAHTINNNLNFNGAWFFQVKKNKNNEIVLMEIAPRIAGTMALYRAKGVNFPLLSVYNEIGEDVNIICNDFKLDIDKALFNRFNIDLCYDHVYVDFDDCLFIKNKINIYLVMFLYQCINKKIKLHLISKHSGNLEKKLKDLKIFEIFNSIIHINKDDNKSKYITYKNSIFIDDSFSERLNVKTNKNIPVFDISSIECLIDWRV